MNLLDNIKNLFSSVGTSNPSVLGIDIGMSTVKIVQIRKYKGKAVLETYGEIATGPYKQRQIGEIVKLNEQEHAQLLQDLMHEINVTTDKAGLSVPVSSSLAVVIKLPPVPDSEINNIVPNEARKYIPMRIEELTLDWMVLPKKDDPLSEWKKINNAQTSNATQSGREVLLVAIHNNILAELQTIVRSAGINSMFYELEAFSILRSSVEDSLYASAIVDIGASSIKVYIVKQGYIRLSYVINASTSELTNTIARSLQTDFKTAEHLKKEFGLDTSKKDPLVNQESVNALVEVQERFYSRIFSEISKVIIDYEKKYSDTVEMVYLSGGGALTKKIENFAQEKLNIKTVKTNPFAVLEYPEFLNDVLKEIGPEFAVSVGLAMRALSK